VFSTRRFQRAACSALMGLARGPVKRNELSEFVGALDHAIERFRNERSGSLAASKLTDKEERNMAKPHLVACFDCKRGNVFGLVLRYEARDALEDLAALFVEGIFPKQAGEHGAPQFEPRIDLLRDCSFISFCANSAREQALPYVQLCHCCFSPFRGLPRDSARISNKIAGREQTARDMRRFTAQLPTLANRVGFEPTSPAP